MLGVAFGRHMARHVVPEPGELRSLACTRSREAMVASWCSCRTHHGSLPAAGVGGGPDACTAPHEGAPAPARERTTAHAVTPGPGPVRPAAVPPGPHATRPPSPRRSAVRPRPYRRAKDRPGDADRGQPPPAGAHGAPTAARTAAPEASLPPNGAAHGPPRTQDADGPGRPTPSTSPGHARPSRTPSAAMNRSPPPRPRRAWAPGPGHGDPSGCSARSANEYRHPARLRHGPGTRLPEH